MFNWFYKRVAAFVPPPAAPSVDDIVARIAANYNDDDFAAAVAREIVANITNAKQLPGSDDIAEYMVNNGEVPDREDILERVADMVCLPDDDVILKHIVKSARTPNMQEILNAFVEELQNTLNTDRKVKADLEDKQLQVIRRYIEDNPIEDIVKSIVRKGVAEWLKRD